MPVKMRLQRHGRTKAPFYHIVIADARAPRDGRFIEKIGTYNPLTKPATIVIDRELAFDWLTKGAQPTDTVRAILRFKGVMYKKHLMRGVNKGAMTVEQADSKLEDFVVAKEAKVASRKDETKVEKEAKRVALFGKAKPKPVVVVPEPEPVFVPEPVVEAVAVAEPVVEAVAEVVAEPVVEVAAAAETVVEVIAEPVVEVAAATEAVVEVVAEPVVETIVEVTNVADLDPEMDKMSDEVVAEA